MKKILLLFLLVMPISKITAIIEQPTIDTVPHVLMQKSLVALKKELALLNNQKKQQKLRCMSAKAIILATTATLTTLAGSYAFYHYSCYGLAENAREVLNDLANNPTLKAIADHMQTSVTSVLNYTFELLQKASSLFSSSTAYAEPEGIEAIIAPVVANTTQVMEASDIAQHNSHWIIQTMKDLDAFIRECGHYQGNHYFGGLLGITIDKVL